MLTITILHEDAVATWSGPEAVALRGTLILLPGRGESPSVYERFGKRLAADAYRVHALSAPSSDPVRTSGLLTALLAESDPAVPRVIVGSDAGAQYAAYLLTHSDIQASALILAGLPVAERTDSAPDWAGELEARTSCPTHRARISDAGVEPGALYDDIPAHWYDAAPEQLGVPVLGIHGADDPLSPLAQAQEWCAKVPQAELVSITGGRHDALNDQTHRTVAATVVLFLERLRLGADLAPIATAESLEQVRRNG